MFETSKSDGSVRREAHLLVLKAYERHRHEHLEFQPGFSRKNDKMLVNEKQFHT